MIYYKDKKYVCHLDLAMELIRGKWKAIILCRLNNGPKRFLELQRMTCGVSQKVLNEKLKELEGDGLIFKTTYPEVPPKVEFELTEMGKEIFPSLNLLKKWALKYEKQLEIQSK
ncbi:winged helix-turn-helix transcriptional regulator [Desulforamulus aeronauticus]|uniref:Transcriptional regulator, HxlR family n=1 Tax=Desulforamulus aeronauticus DSM 10349 TaxID=1121421 RepID=A0A1M6QBY3_9FIRM|nr:helix-turn-helix domain-containing protein [Desulforamulus aeronauticus]SHK17587.1 transcriptional regulator, HxlR family [Desulforamulus aeronauticus DSM 10349]